ncbi:hypothetical protein IG631_01256 [Alternaria alternata]|jgi:hypothetical protein|nr:hypothetical protein IG631_01256 [Alternaria alternata]
MNVCVEDLPTLGHRSILRRAQTRLRGLYGSNWESCRDRRLHGQVTMQVNGAMLLGRAVPRSWEASGLRHKMLGVEQGVLQSHDTRRGTSV